jgi:hypothetical protein
MEFGLNQLKSYLSKLENGEIKPDELIQDEFAKITMLHMVIKSDTIPRIKEQYIKYYINLGCSVDQYSTSASTPISFAAQGVANGTPNTHLVRTMLKHHQKGHRSDLDILKSASGSLDKDMFKEVLLTGMVDTNTTQMRGSHILHHLADVEGYDDLIKILFELAPETIVNPIHRKGVSPLAIAINGGMEKNALQLAIPGGKIIGKITDPQMVVELGMVEDYEGDFFDDFPTMVEYAANNGHEDQLPKTVTDMFLF